MSQQQISEAPNPGNDLTYIAQTAWRSLRHLVRIPPSHYLPVPGPR